MKKRKKFYKITKKGGTCTATTFYKSNRYIMFQEKVQNLRQFDSALMTTNFDGSHDLYLPVRGGYNKIYIDMKCLPILKNIESYQYLNGILLLRYASGAYTFVDIYSAYFYSEDGQIFTDKLPEFHATNAVFLKFTVKKYGQEKTWIYSADGSVFHSTLTHTPCGEHKYRQISLETAEQLPCDNWCFKASNENGQFIDQGYADGINNPKYYPSITPFSDADYPNILSKSDGFYAYWNKDQNGNILGFSFYKYQVSLWSYSIILEKPAKELYFIRRLELTRGKKVDFWKVAYIDGSCDVCVWVDNEKTFFVKDSDFL